MSHIWMSHVTQALGRDVGRRCLYGVADITQSQAYKQVHTHVHICIHMYTHAHTHTHKKIYHRSSLLFLLNVWKLINVKKSGGGKLGAMRSNIALEYLSWGSNICDILLEYIAGAKIFELLRSNIRTGCIASTFLVIIGQVISIRRYILVNGRSNNREEKHRLANTTCVCINVDLCINIYA